MLNISTIRVVLHYHSITAMEIIVLEHVEPVKNMLNYARWDVEPVRVWCLGQILPAPPS